MNNVCLIIYYNLMGDFGGAKEFLEFYYNG